jgi:hypothetical protein
VELNPFSDTMKAPAQAFTGDVYVTPLQKPREPSRLIASLVRFTPCARTNWHSHAIGQTLHVTEGVGLSPPATAPSSACAPATPSTPRPARNTGTATTFMSHIAMLEGVEDGDGTTWLEPVTEEQYQAAQRH